MTLAQTWQDTFISADSVYIVALEHENTLLRKKSSLDSADYANKKAAYDVAISKANGIIADQAKQVTVGSTANRLLSTRLDQCSGELVTARNELYEWKPRTKAGLFFRKGRDGLATVGGATVLYTILKLFVF